MKKNSYNMYSRIFISVADRRKPPKKFKKKGFTHSKKINKNIIHN